MSRSRWILVAGTWLVVALLTKTLPDSEHEYSRLGTVESIVKRGTYQLDDSSFPFTRDRILNNGHYYSHQAPVLATLEAPVFWALQLTGIGFNNRGRELTTYLFSLLTNGVALVLTVLVFSYLFELAGIRSPAREWLAVVLPMGTWLLPYGVTNNNHGISALLLTVVAYLLLRIDWHGATPRRCLALGAALGLITVIEYLPLVSFLPLTIIYLAVRRDLTASAWRAFAAALAVPLLAHSAINLHITGDVIPAGFHTELFDYPGTGFEPRELTGSIKYDSVSAAGAYAWQSLFAGKGYFTFAPVLALGLAMGVAGWRWWGRARGPHLVLLAGTAASLGASLLTTNNFGGAAVGFRHATYLAPAMLVLLLPIIAGHGRAARAATYAVAMASGLSATVLLLFAVKQPWTPLYVTSGSIATWDWYFPVVPMVIGALEVAASFF
jgi:hypothetical protein